MESLLIERAVKNIYQFPRLLWLKLRVKMLMVNFLAVPFAPPSAARAAARGPANCGAGRRSRLQGLPRGSDHFPSYLQGRMTYLNTPFISWLHHKDSFLTA